MRWLSSTLYVAPLLLEILTVLKDPFCSTLLFWIVSPLLCSRVGLALHPSLCSTEEVAQETGPLLHPQHHLHHHRPITIFTITTRIIVD